MAKQRHNAKLKIKKGDTVEVISGDYKGYQGEVLQVLPEKNKAIVADVNIVTKHKKPQGEDAGGRVEMEAPIHISNLMLLDPKTQSPTRVGRRIEGDKSVRFSKKSGEIID